MPPWHPGCVFRPHGERVPAVTVKVENALNEARTLVLVVQILIGFEFQSFFQPGFERLPPLARDLKLAALALELLCLALLLWPAARHQIVEEGHDTSVLHAWVTKVLTVALLPFALALAFDLYLAVEMIVGSAAAVGAGAAALAVALVAWYGLGAIQGGRIWPSRELGSKEEDVAEETKLETRVKQVLTETRVVLPGVQALLGFQLMTVFVDGFERLPPGLKYVHLLSLGMMALSAVLLMAPPAYHRIVEEGQDTERFHRVASRFLLASMPPLALGIAGDVYVVVSAVTHHASAAATCAALTVALFFGLWFGWTLFRRSRRAGVPRRMGTEPPRLAA
jgi:hypothetical protein